MYAKPAELVKKLVSLFLTLTRSKTTILSGKAARPKPPKTLLFVSFPSLTLAHFLKLSRHLLHLLSLYCSFDLMNTSLSNCWKHTLNPLRLKHTLCSLNINMKTGI